VVKSIEAPVFHVNGDDPEAVVFVTKLALDYRMKFRKDVVVDIVCFRKLGHNEQDTPSATQPLMYKRIGVHPGTRKLYADRLEAQGTIEKGYADHLVTAFRDAMDAGKHTVDPVITNHKRFASDWSQFLNRKWTDAGDTGLPISELKRLGERITQVPEGFKLMASTPSCPIAGMADEDRHFYGVQFHPESFITEYGKEMLRNWLMR